MRAVPSLRWAAGGVLAVGLLTRAMGLIREMIQAREFGVGRDLDMVLLGLSVPVAIAAGVGGGLGRAVVPVAAALPPGKFRGLLATGTRRLAIGFAPVALALAATCPFWTRWLLTKTDGSPGRELMAAAALGSLSLIGSALGGFAIGLSNAAGRHVSATFNQVFYNAIVIGALLAFGHRLGPLSVAVGVFLAEWAQLALQWPLLLVPLRGAKAAPAGKEWGQVQALFWASALIGLSGSVTTVIDRTFAHWLPPGGVSALAYADKLVNLPVGLIGLAVGLPLYTRLSRYVAGRDRRAFDDTIALGFRVLFLTGLPAGVALALLGEPAVALLLKRGAFTADAVRLCCEGLRGYALAIPFMAMLPLLCSAGLAARRSAAVLVVLLGTLALNWWLDLVLVQRAGLLGITFATTLVAFARSGLIVLVLSPKLVVRADLWLSVLHGVAYSAVLGGGLWLVRWIAGSRWEGPATTRALILGAGVAVTCVITAALWKPLLRREWKSLHQLRQRAAADAGRLREATNPRPTTR